MKTAIQIAAEIYSEAGLRLSDDLEYYLKFGYVFCTPGRFLMAREILREDRGESYVPPGEGNCWYVRMAVGEDCLAWFIKQAPYMRPWVGWARGFKRGNNNINFYSFEKLKRKFPLHFCNN